MCIPFRHLVGADENLRREDDGLIALTTLQSEREDDGLIALTTLH